MPKKTQIKIILSKWQPAFDWLPLLLLPFITPVKNRHSNNKKPVSKNNKISQKPNRNWSLINLKNIIPTTLLIIGIIGVIYFGISAKQPVDLQPESQYIVNIPVAKKQPDSEKIGLAPSKPLQISIPSIEVDVPIKEVGKKSDDSMETPPLFENITGWYNLGPTPGEIGPAIIVGHVDTYKGPSVFWRLKEMKPGQIISVKRQDGKSVKFKVDGLEQFDQDNFPTEKVYGNTDYAGLRLITCGGTYNKQTQRYSQNTVVFATAILK